MDISKVGIALIQKFEGCKLGSYKPVPTEKYWTIGWGHYGADVKEHQKITQAEADALLKKDLKKYVDGVKDALKVPVNQNQFDALVSFAYNCGIGALKESDMLDLINKKHFADAAKEFDKYVHSGKTVLEGLVRRRNDEQALFLKAVPVPPKPKVTVKKYVSLVDYLNAHHMTSDYHARAYLAASHGIRNYTGTADQNIKLLNLLQK